MESYFDDVEKEELELAIDETIEMMAEQIPRTCGECFYFVEQFKDSTCHRHAPTVISYDQGSRETVYPSINQDYAGCGDGLKSERRIYRGTDSQKI